MEELEAMLLSLPHGQQRAALSLLGLAVGDVVGLPFELRVHRHNRKRADEVAEDGAQALQHLVLELVVERLGRSGPGNMYARTFSDDTACTDCKMAAIAECSELRQCADFSRQDPGDLLWKCLLAQLLAWSGGAACGQLFQGYGGFTKGLLRPNGRERGPAPCMDICEDLAGCKTWPEEWFFEHAEAHCAGSKPGTVASYGNGAVMSMAPQVVASLVAKEEVTLPNSALARLSGTHRHPDAVVAASLLVEVLQSALQENMASCEDLPRMVRESQQWRSLLQGPLSSHPAYPISAFNSFLLTGDCSEGDALSFIVNLTQLESPPLDRQFTGPGMGAEIGRLLRTAANWDDAFSGTDGAEERHICLPNGEAVRFSQRALNSVLIALWCCSGAKTTWDWIQRVIYVGGDADTIGSICGQIASPLLPMDDVILAFGRYVAVAHCPRRRFCADMAGAAACRYFKRVLLFCSGQWHDLAHSERLVDPQYQGLTDAHHYQHPVAARVLWVDAAFSHGHQRRAGTARKHACTDAEKRGALLVRRCCSVRDAIEALQYSRNGGEPFDSVVSELDLEREPRAGLELMQVVDSLWEGEKFWRPLFCLLTPHHDGEVNAFVRSRPRSCHVRHDRPDQIIKTVTEGQCSAAALPTNLEPLATQGILTTTFAI